MFFRNAAGVLALVFCAAPLWAQAEVGENAPTDNARQQFIDAWVRNGFFRNVGPPTSAVVKYGSTGYIQQFPPAVSSITGNLALIKADALPGSGVYQVQQAMFAYFGTVGVTAAGYPTRDTADCPALLSYPNNSCQWQPFSNGYVLFTYTNAPIIGGTDKTFALKGTLSTRWTATGGIDVLGPATADEGSVTSSTGITATGQTFDRGAIYSITSGSATGRVIAVKSPVYAVYVASGGPTGSMGLPTSDELNLANGFKRQTFEAGAIDYDPATGIATLRPPIARIGINPSGTTFLKVGDSITATAGLTASDGSSLTDRTISWNTSNGRAVSIQATGLTAKLTAVGAGTASITVSGEGKTSGVLVISVTSPCCQIGEGAPSTAARQALQDAVTRNKLAIQLPSPSLATRVGNGYAQELFSTSTPPVSYLVTVADGSAAGYLVAGSLLNSYNSLGGATGVLGYPTSDATVNGRQNFQKGSLAGNPAVIVTGAILTRWAALGYETGTFGPPTSAAIPFQTFRGTTGVSQSFRSGLVAAVNGGAAYAIGEPIRTAYAGAAADLGAPTTEERLVNGFRQQDFEGGIVTYAVGATSATVTLRPRQPLVTATPATVVSGGTIHLSLGGFNNGASVRVSQTGQADFTVAVPNGTFAWDVFVPATAASATVTVRAVDGANTAQATYAIRNVAGSLMTLSVVGGDLQTGAAGALLPQPLTIAVKDSAGIPVPGQTVVFEASAGSKVSPGTVVTNTDGQATTTLRLPSNPGIALATAQAARQVVTFSARANAFSLTNFPGASQGVDGLLNTGPDTIRNKGALLSATAAMVRFYQNQGDMPQPFGLADPLSLNLYLSKFCDGALCDGFLTIGAQTNIANLWRVGGFVAGNAEVRVESPDESTVRDLVASGSPVLLALALNTGTHFVVATGVGSDGSLLIADPAGAQTRLSGYPGKITGAVRFLPQAPSPGSFLLAGTTPLTIASSGGECGQVFAIGTAYLRSCDGLGGPYQAAGAGATFTDLSAGGTRIDLPAQASVVRNGNRWAVSPLTTSFAASSILNAASFTGDIAPGGLVSIFGLGLNGATVQVNGQAATVLASFPFQVNAQIPASAVPGSAEITVTSTSGSAKQTAALSATAPAIFSIGAGQAAITNQNNSLNTPSNPAGRGSFLIIYGTGFGTTSRSANVDRVTTPVRIDLNGTELPTAFAGLTPGAIGLYQVNVQIPAAFAPGLALPLRLKQGDAVSNSVTAAVQ